MAEPHSVLLATYDVDPASHDQLRDLLTEGLEDTVRHRAGFVRAMLLSAPDRCQIVNIAEWRRSVDLEATREDPAVAAFARRAATLATQGAARLHLVARVEG